MSTKTVYLTTQLINLLVVVVNIGVYFRDDMIFNIVVAGLFVVIMVTWHLIEGKKYLKG